MTGWFGTLGLVFEITLSLLLSFLAWVNEAKLCGRLRLRRKHVAALGTEAISPESPPGPLSTNPFSLN